MKKVAALFLVFIAFLAVALMLIRVGNRTNLQIKSQDFVLTRLSGETLAFPVPHKKIIVIFWKMNDFLSEFYLKKINLMLQMGQVSVNDVIVIAEDLPVTRIENYLVENEIQLMIAKNTNKTLLNPEQDSNATLIFINERSQIVYESSIPHPSLEKDTLAFLKP